MQLDCYRRLLALAVLSLVLASGCATTKEDLLREIASDPDRLFDATAQSLSTQNYAAAEQQIRRAIALRPGSGRFLQMLALVKTVQREYPAALEAADQALGIDSTLTDARNNRGLALLNLGRPAEAEADFRAVLGDSKFPQKIHPRFNLGMAILRQGRAAEALAEFYEVLKMDPDSAGIHYFIGEAREAMGDCERAVANYLEELKKSPRDLECQMRLGGCLEKLGQMELAKRYYERIVQNAPGSPEASEANHRLANLTHPTPTPP